MHTIKVLFHFLTGRKTSTHHFVIAIFSGVLAGASTASLIALIHTTLQAELTPTRSIIFQFIGFLIGHGLFSFLSTWSITKLVQQIIYEIRLDLSDQLLDTPLHIIESIGKSKILTHLTHVVDNIGRAIERLPGLFVRLALLLGLLGYMAWLSPILLTLLIAFLGLGIFVYILPMKSFRRFQRFEIEANSLLLKQLHSLVEGIRELLQNRKKRTAFRNYHFEPANASLRQAVFQARLLNTTLSLWGEIYLIIGVSIMLFILPALSVVTLQEVRDFLLIFMFALAPISTVIGYIYTLEQLQVGLDNLVEIGLHLGQGAKKNKGPTSTLETNQPIQLDLENVTYCYEHSEKDETFMLGPINLALSDPQILFIAGGNGSGKSTLAKLICGLYRPEQGLIWLNDQQITEANVESYRQLFSVIYFDFFLFDTLLGMESESVDERAGGLLKRLKLDHKVTVSGGEYSTTDLSQGQRKRLALLHAYVEDKPIIIFDEWAADQDPSFKEIFYEELLPQLKQEEKMVIVITHDSSYFHVADNILMLEDGQPAETEMTASTYS
ncbi:MAG: cyclic peptide export ABC transporter [Chloroflexota bacterium]